jgi:hypothetical protein
MYAPFAPMSSQTVTFAKDYRAEQIRAAEQSRIAAQFMKPRRPVSTRVSSLWTAVSSWHTPPTPAAGYSQRAH